MKKGQNADRQYEKNTGNVPLCQMVILILLVVIALLVIPKLAPIEGELINFTHE